jgi:hypothetical protein
LGCDKEEKRMKREVGLWIDHMKAVIVTVVGEKEETHHVRSNIDKLVHFSGGSRERPMYGTSSIPGESKQDRKYANYLSSYYDGVVSLIRHADSIWIFGPGDAKEELQQHLQRDPLYARLVDIETVDKMSDRQIAAKVHAHYQK